MRKNILLIAIIFGLILNVSGKCLAAYSLEVTGYAYNHNFTAGETVTFTINVKNPGQDITGVYFSPVLTNSDTSAEVYPPGSATQSILSGATAAFSTTWPAIAGKYSVTLIMYGNAPAADTEVAREYGAYPIRAGSSATTESLKVFPTIMDFGVIPYGRHIHPVPLEITWDFFLYNALRDQQPWYMRIYTDNAARFKGVEDAV